MGDVQLMGSGLQERRHKLFSSFLLPAGWNEEGTVGAGAATLEHTVEASHWGRYCAKIKWNLLGSLMTPEHKPALDALNLCIREMYFYLVLTYNYFEFSDNLAAPVLTNTEKIVCKHQGSKRKIPFSCWNDVDKQLQRSFDYIRKNQGLILCWKLCSRGSPADGMTLR